VSGDCPALVAHRGGLHDGTTENGMEGIRRTRALGVLDFEVDLRTASDGSLWAMHYDDVSHTTDGAGLLSRMTPRQVRALTLHDGGFVPNVSDVLRYAALGGMRPVLHVKAMTAASWDRLRERLGAFGMTRTTTVFGSAAVIEAARVEVSRTRKVLEYNPVTTPLTAAGNVAAVAVSEARTTPERVAAAHAAGLAYWVGTPADPEAWRRYGEWGVDALFVDRVEEYREACPGVLP
jgi:glycerophosphoryl diester phosphodiesterase